MCFFFNLFWYFAEENLIRLWVDRTLFEKEKDKMWKKVNDFACDATDDRKSLETVAR